MQELKMFGFPVVFDATDDKLVPNAEGVSYEAYSRKYSKGMCAMTAPLLWLAVLAMNLRKPPATSIARFPARA